MEKATRDINKVYEDEYKNDMELSCRSFKRNHQLGWTGPDNKYQYERYCPYWLKNIARNPDLSVENRVHMMVFGHYIIQYILIDNGLVTIEVLNKTGGINETVCARAFNMFLKEMTLEQLYQKLKGTKVYNYFCDYALQRNDCPLGVLKTRYKNV